MERRTFIQGAFGLIVLAAGGACAMQAVTQPNEGACYVTPAVASPQTADGPVMAAGIRLEPQEDGTVRGATQDIHLFTVDQTGAQLIRLADGSHTIEDMAAFFAEPLKAADVASFFVTLGQAGYLANTVMVNLVEIPA